METETIQIPLEVIQKNIDALKKTADGLADISKHSQEIISKQEQLRQTFTRSWTEINNAIQVAKQAYQALKGAIDQTVGVVIKQADAVRTLNQINMQSAQANSRLIETLDDYKLSSEDAITAQRKLATQGQSLTIPTLAALSDEYLKLNSGTERQTFLTENFGRASAGWAEVMSQGSQAIKDRAASISDSLILDQAAIDKAREYEYKLDDMNDAYKALKMSVGTHALDLVINLMTTVTQAGSSGIVTREVDNLNALLDLASGKSTSIGAKFAWGAWGPEIQTLTVETEKWNAALIVAQSILSNQKYQRDYLTNVKNLAIGISGLTADMDPLNTELAKYKSQLQNIAGLPSISEVIIPPIDTTGIDNMDKAWRSVTEDTLERIKAVNAEFANMYGFVTNYAASYTTAVENTRGAEAELAEMRKNGWKYTADEIAKAEQKVLDYIQAEKDAASQAIVKQVAGAFEKSGGMMTGEEYKTLMDMNVAYGLMTPAAAAAAVAAWEVANAIAAIPEDKLAQFRLNIGIEGIDKAIADMMALRNMSYQAAIYAWAAENSQYPPANPQVPEDDHPGEGGAAGGGTFAAGSWAMVGDAYGGRKTPYTEFVHANPGGGFTVFNQSQMAGHSAPPMAAGGYVPPTSGDTNLSDASIRKLADALFMRQLAMGQ